MSQSDYFDWLLKIGMGWIGWTYEQTLDTPMLAIVDAHKGRMAMLRAIFGGDDPDIPSIPQKPVSIIKQLAALQKKKK